MGIQEGAEYRFSAYVRTARAKESSRTLCSTKSPNPLRPEISTALMGIGKNTKPSFEPLRSAEKAQLNLSLDETGSR